jgi:hypothetical protein
MRLVKLIIGVLTKVSNILDIFKGNAMNEANFNGVLLAYTFGRTSPKRRINVVINTTSIKNFNQKIVMAAKMNSPT